MNDTTQNLEHKNICNKKSLDAEITYQVICCTTDI